MCSGCSMAPFAKTAGSSVPASLRPDARPSSARAANNRACSGQNKEQRMSWLCVASTAANDSTRSGNTASINTPDAMTPFLFQLNEESCPAPLPTRLAQVREFHAWERDSHASTSAGKIARSDTSAKNTSASSLSIEPDDFDCPFHPARRLGPTIPPFGEQLPKLLDQLNTALAAQYTIC